MTRDTEQTAKELERYADSGDSDRGTSQLMREAASLLRQQAQQIKALREAFVHLEHIYDRDGVAQPHAGMIEKIFDAVIHGEPTANVDDAALASPAPSEDT